jgi:hypothetical protein
MASGEVKTFDVLSLRLYSGTKEQAFDMARRDKEQHIVDKILYHWGDVNTRTSMTFKVKFMDGDVKDIVYSKDLFDSIAYEEYCDAKPYLRHLKLTTTEAKKYINGINKKPITGFSKDQEVFLDIRLYGDGWFNKLQLPDTQTMMYVSKFKILTCTSKKMNLINVITNDNHILNAYQIFCYIHTNYEPASMIIIDEAFMLEYPQVTQD